MEILKQFTTPRYITYFVPVIGVCFFGWNAYFVLLFFCIENILQGVFFFLKGLVCIRYGGGFMFLLVFGLIYFFHIIFLFNGVNEIANMFHIIAIPSIYTIAINVLLVSIPNFINLFHFAKTQKTITAITTNKNLSKKEIKNELVKKDISPLINFILSAKEMMLRIATLWLTMPFVMIILFLSIYFHFVVLVSSTLLVIVFSIIHFKVETYLLSERVKIFNLYNLERVQKINEIEKQQKRT